MSYQSKYTGQEIEALLDKVNAGGGSVTELYVGEKLTTSTETVTLSDDITKYDAVLVEGSLIKGDNAVSNLIMKPVIMQQYGISYIWTSNIYYAFGFRFEDSRTFMLVSTSISSGWNTNSQGKNVGIDKIYGIKFGSGDSTPTGNIISFMGTKAPKGYLICDGAEYNIADYPKLASHFEEQFEDVGYFGGDGVNTFKVPDLRNEFLRGQGELSGNIGEHQDATQLPAIYASNYGKNFYTGGYDFNGTGNTNTFANTDTVIKNKDLGTDTSKYGLASTTDRTANLSSKWAEVAVKYTTRPTNVAVLYCIKY